MSLFTPNTSFHNNYYDKARHLMAWRISLSFSFVFLILSIIYSFINLNVIILFLTVIGIAGGSLIYLKMTKNFAPLFWIYAISGTILSQLATNLFFEFPHYVDFLWMVATILLAFVIDFCCIVQPIQKIQVSRLPNS